MAYENFENGIIESFGYDVETGKINPTIKDLQLDSAQKKYQKYIKKIIELKPREFFIDSIPKTESREDFFKMAYYLVLQIFGKEYLSEFSELVRDKLYVSNSKEILEGISLQLIEKDNPTNIKRAIEIPDFDHISSIIALLHEYTHYHCQLMKMDYNQKRYYEEILSIYVEKRATELLSQILFNPRLQQMISETRLEGIVWHYDTHEKEVKEFLQEVDEVKKFAKVHPLAALQLMSYEQQIPWIKTPATIRTAEQYRKNLATSYGLGYLYSEALMARYRDDELRTNAKVGATLSGDLSLQGLLDYFGINANNDEVYAIADKSLEKVRKNK